MAEDRVLGYGSYNCAILKDGKRVVRVTAVKARDTSEDDDLKEKMMVRAGEILFQFNQMERSLGPCVLKETRLGHWLEPAEMDEAVRKWLFSFECPVLQKPDLLRDYRLYVQEIEFAEKGELVHGFSDSRHVGDEFAFMLVWFFYVAQAHFGFRHRDLKPANIVVREYAVPQRFRFKLGSTQFEMETKYAPVVIDLDFGSFLTTNETTRIIEGTPYFMPMEITLDQMRYRAPSKRPPHGDAVDWYSLGLTLLMFWCDAGKRWYRLFGVEDRMMDHYGVVRRDANFQKSGTASLCMHIVLAYEFGLPIPLDLVEAAEAIELRKTPFARFLHEEITAHLEGKEDRIALMRQLLHPYPKKRYANGKAWKIIARQPLFRQFVVNCSSWWNPFAACKDAARGTKTYSYGVFPALSTLDPASDRYALLVRNLHAMPSIALCASCSTVTATMCPCCTTPYCGVECQAIGAHSTSK